MRQGLKEGRLYQTMLVGLTADLKDTIQDSQLTKEMTAGTIGPGEGRKIIRQIGR